MTAKETILVVEDEQKIADVLKSYLEREGFSVVCAADGEEALRLHALLSPALVLLDLMLPKRSGEDVCREIRARGNTPVIMLTAKTEEASILGGLAIGADDYVIKPFSPRQVVARVHAVLRRAAALQPVALRFGGGRLVLDTAARMVYRDGEEVTLTPSEYSLLLALASHPGRTFTRDELIYLALRDDYEGYDRVIDTHIKNLRQKIESDLKQPRYLITVHGVGYRFGGGET
ncbi:MAG: response regulator transcription factor [Eubacteriales bacterium]|jgi:DNA-binding response OmpR family regulator|nr:response regulator transcription factor [Eubacteriales bacterium]